MHRHVVVKDAGCLGSPSVSAAVLQKLIWKMHSSGLNLNVICKYFYALFFRRWASLYFSEIIHLLCTRELLKVSLGVLYICYAGRLKLNSFAYFSTFFLLSRKWSLPDREQHHRSCSGNSHSYRWVLLLVSARLLRSACSFVFACCSSSALCLHVQGWTGVFVCVLVIRNVWIPTDKNWML